MEYQQTTDVVRVGLNSDEQFGCVVPPIYLSSTYSFADFEQPRTHDYSRRGNPGRDIVQSTLASIEGGEGAVLTNSGTSAIHLICTTLLGPNDLLVAPHDCYGGSYRLFNSLSERGTFQVEFVDQGNEHALIKALERRPKVVLIESPSNPLLRIVDIHAICQAAHNVGALVVVDNTFMSPILQQPLQLGADLVVHSCTKYLNGHSDVVAGAVIAKNLELATELAWWANNIGVTSAAFDCYLLSRGLRTLALRIKQAQENAEVIVNFLQNHSNVKQVYYPGLKSHPGHEIACRQQKGFGAMLSVELHGDKAELKQFLSALKLFTLAESLGGVESLISHPATMTHVGMSAEARQQAGISDTLVRLSIGIEDSKDLIADLSQALASINY